MERILTRFMDTRANGFYRVAAVNVKNHISNPVANVNEHIETLGKLMEEGVQYAIFPELSISSYSNGELFFSMTIIKSSERELIRLMKNTPINMVVTVGMPVMVKSNLYNCAVTYQNNKILAVVPKIHLPNNREFYEGRYFAHALNADCDIIEFCGQSNVPFGIDIIVSLGNDVNVYTDVCQDFWVPIPYSRVAALAGATILANASASPINIGKNEYRKLLVQAQSGTCIAAQLFTSAIRESSTDLAWDGQLIIAERGNVLSESELFVREGTYIVSDINIPSLISDRMQDRSFSQNRDMFKNQFRFVNADRKIEEYRCERKAQDPYKSFKYPLERFPFVPSDQEKLNERCEQTFMIQANGLIQRLESLPEHMRKAILGLSGGLDSTQALLVIIYAFDKLGIDRKNIFCVTMPGFGTTDRTKNNAVALAEVSGVTLIEISIKDQVNLMFKDVGFVVKKEGKNLTFENAQAWARTDVLFIESAIKGGIVIGTGDLSEMALGWCTYKGDHMSHYNVNCGVPKTLIKFLVEWVANNKYVGKAREILLDIVDTEISPELLPAENGEITQKTEEIVGPYALNDFFIYYFVRFGFDVPLIARLCYEAFKDEYSLVEIKKWLRNFIKRFFQNQFKRSCVPDGPKVGLVSLSPRGDWRMPSDAEVDIWLSEINLIPDEV